MRNQKSKLTTLSSSKGRLAYKACFLGASSMVLAMAAPAAFAQIGEGDEIVVTGIRASLDRAQDLKRNSDGVVDAISAEDIGKFPDTNLAESLQRITGVSINRVNGEGSQVTVRGFSGDFNLVTLNGRTMPGADVPLAGTDRNGTAGNTRAFDFSNLASEAVSGIQVYKTGKSTLPSGGIGATVNIATARPLDNPGFNLSVGGKLLSDTSVDTGDDITPEVSGLASWTNDAETFGVGVFGSYQDRDSAAAASSTAGWDTISVDQLLNNGAYVDENTNLQNASSDLDSLVGIPFDSRYHFSELERERVNGQLVLQYAPNDNLTLTGDVLYARTDNNETRSDISNWFGGVFDEIVLDSNTVATPLLLSRTHDGAKDYAFSQEEIGTRDELTSFGINAEWQATDRLQVTLDAHSSKAEVSPTLNSTAAGRKLSRVPVGVGAGFVDFQTQTFGGTIPQQDVIINNGADGDPGVSSQDISTTVANDIFSTTQENQIDEFDLRGEWEVDDSSSFTAGVNFRSQENVTDQTGYQQVLGFWNAGQPGDIDTYAPGVLEQFCLTCKFDDFSTGIAAGSPTSQSFRGSANDLLNAISGVYASRDGNTAEVVAAALAADGTVLERDFRDGEDNTLRVTSTTLATVQEDITAVFAAFDKSFSIAGRDANLSVGLRYEETDLTSSSVFTVPTAYVFTSDNDNNVTTSETPQSVSESFSYDHFLPNVDMSIDVTDDIKARASYSKTIARAGFGNLVTNTTVDLLSGQTAFGATPTAEAGNPRLLPLESDNYDFSVEWYYAPSSFVTAGVFAKRVDNFIGSGTVESELFGLTDPLSGETGTISGDALAILQSTAGANVDQINLFTVARLLENGPDNATVAANFAASINASGGSDLTVTVDGTSFSGGAGDPALTFLVTQQLNNQEGQIQGVELAAQHFFGDTGFGLAGSYTYVDGDVDFDVTAPVGSNQFALTGLSDTANASLIYDKNGLSARLSYNWRDTFLASTNYDRGNPLFVEEFSQWDANVSYDINDQIAVSFEAINIGGEDLRTFSRSKNQIVFAQELDPRYLIGARYKF